VALRSSRLFPQRFGKTCAESPPEAHQHARKARHGPKRTDPKEPDLKQPSPWETIGLGTLAAVVGLSRVLARWSSAAVASRPKGPDVGVLAAGFAFCSAAST
jgi:hypothetical protein